MNPTAKYVALGLATYVPGLHAALRRGTGGTNSARYCYSVWMRHMLQLKMAGVGVPKVVAELGPGDSLGIGLSALLCGAESYIALDAVPHAFNSSNLKVFDELVHLFRARSPIPGPAEFPAVKPSIPAFDFPEQLFPQGALEQSLRPERLAALRDDLAHGKGALRYVAPWEHMDPADLPRADLIFSQAVLEHVDALEPAYAAMSSMLNDGGHMSHQIDFRCHGTATAWNGHLAYPDWLWSTMRGKLPYLLNRSVLSDHLGLLERNGFTIKALQPVRSLDGLPANALAPRYRHLGTEDVTTSGAYVLVAKS